MAVLKGDITIAPAHGVHEVRTDHPLLDTSMNGGKKKQDLRLVGRKVCQASWPKSEEGS
jgi:hypothetical protein